MRKNITAALLLAALLSTLVPAVARAADSATHDELAVKYSPIWYQDVADLKKDAITRFDFDGDWVGNNNWENLDSAWTAGECKGYTYYSVAESETHFFITYTDYHPRDWDSIDSDLWSHENDMEGAQVVVKKNGTYYGEFLLMETEAHINLYQYSSHPGVHDGRENIDGGVILEDGTHPQVFVESKGHGVYAHDGSPFPGGDGIIYRHGTPEQPSVINDPDVGYGLINIRDTLWPRRFDIGNGNTYGGSYTGFWDGSGYNDTYSVNFDGDTYGDDKANPPWGWDDGDDGDVFQGDWFLRPAYTMYYHLTIDGPYSQEYVYNWYTDEYDPLTVTSAAPGSVDLDTGAPPIQVNGTGFMQGVRATLSGNGHTYPDVRVQDCTGASFTAEFDLAGAVPGTYDVIVTNPDARNATLPGAVTLTADEPGPPPGPTPETSDTWYLAEGSSDWGFETYINIQNPGSRQVRAAVTYMTDAGPKPREDVVLPPGSQVVVNPRTDLGSEDFSTLVTCLEGDLIAVDRRMIWTGPGALSPEGHSSVGVTEPATRWYLPEGSSDWGFECWLLIQNPGGSNARCRITYMIEGRPPVTVEKDVPAGSRRTFNMADDIGPADASIMVESDVGVIPERAMYRNNRREGHDSIGTTQAATEYLLAEGTTDWGFTTYVLVQNPNSEPATVTLTCMTQEGPSPQPAFVMPANSRKTVRVNDILPGEDLSTLVHADRPVIAERAMYWNSGSGEACHDSIGMASAHDRFYLPDGETYNGHETWTLVGNPNGEAVVVEVTYMRPGGEGNVSFTDTVPANSRRTFNMADKIPDGRAGVMVRSLQSGRPIICERAMYWSSRGAGTDTIGGSSD